MIFGYSLDNKNNYMMSLDEKKSRCCMLCIYIYIYIIYNTPHRHPNSIRTQRRLPQNSNQTADPQEQTNPSPNIQSAPPPPRADNPRCPPAQHPQTEHPKPSREQRPAPEITGRGSREEEPALAARSRGECPDALPGPQGAFSLG